MSVNIALVRFIYPHRMIGRGVGNVALVVAMASAAGPTVAAAILSVATWPWLFLVNLPVGLLALAVAARTLPATPRSGGRFDLRQRRAQRPDLRPAHHRRRRARRPGDRGVAPRRDRRRPW